MFIWSLELYCDVAYKSIIMTVVQRHRLLETVGAGSAQLICLAFSGTHFISCCLLCSPKWAPGQSHMAGKQWGAGSQSGSVAPSQHAGAREAWSILSPGLVLTSAPLFLLLLPLLPLLSEFPVYPGGRQTAAWKVVVLGRILSCCLSFDQRSSSASSSSAFL